MAENQEKSKRFTFEGDTDDSHYFGVKRIEFRIWKGRFPFAKNVHGAAYSAALRTND
jgi:hypothetical protein